MDDFFFLFPCLEKTLFPKTRLPLILSPFKDDLLLPTFTSSTPFFSFLPPEIGLLFFAREPSLSYLPPSCIEVEIFSPFFLPW